jgi:hypothetical protein
MNTGRPAVCLCWVLHCHMGAATIELHVKLVSHSDHCITLCFLFSRLVENRRVLEHKIDVRITGIHRAYFEREVRKFVVAWGSAQGSSLVYR